MRRLRIPGRVGPPGRGAGMRRILGGVGPAGRGAGMRRILGRVGVAGRAGLVGRVGLAGGVGLLVRRGPAGCARRVLAAAGALALALGAPAAARSTDTPVVGGGSFNAAPILPPGSYSDTVLPAEYIYYAVRVGPGQRLRLSGHTGLGATELLHLGVSEVFLTIHSPTRMDVSPFSDGQAEADIGAPGGASFAGPTAKPGGDSDTDGPWTGPGVYFVSVQAEYRGSELDPPRAEIPFHFTIALEGTPQPTPSPTPVRTATARPTATPTATPARRHGGGAAVAAGAGIAGLLIGVVAGLALRRNRR